MYFTLNIHSYYFTIWSSGMSCSTYDAWKCWWFTDAIAHRLLNPIKKLL